MSEWPEGTVTVLFTDIEGSTRLLHGLGRHYARVLEDHQRLLREVFTARGGHEVHANGDSFFVVFAQAADAVAAAAEAQRALHQHSWPAGGAVRVRMGLHTGQAQRIAHDYVGLDVHHGARLADAGHGGQALISEATRDAVRHDLPQGVSLRALGRHQLRDLKQGAQIYQLIVPGLPDKFPLLRTISLRPNNLPAPTTEFIGRQGEVDAANALLQRPEVRLLTLSGMGGIGKTRLALRTASEMLGEFEDGVFLVSLAELREPHQLLPAIAQALEVPRVAGQTLLATLKQHLKSKRLLLVLDNFEHILEAATDVATVLAACSGVKVLATSRVLLHLSGEHELPVPPLALPDLLRLPAVEALSQVAAVQLFVQRATALKPDFALGDDNAATVSEICTRLDGLPLAIELAAPRARVLPLDEILSGLDKSLHALTDGARDLPQRHQTLRDCIAWSYDLLEADERALFERLAVFVGGCDLEAAQAILDAGSALGVADGLWALRDKSFLVATEQNGQTHFSMLETVREFALERLEASGEANTWRERHAEHFLRIVEDAERQLSGEAQIEWLRHFEREAGNLRAALRWTLREKPEEALRLAGALWHIWPTGLHDINVEILHLARERGDSLAMAASLGHMGYAAIYAGRYAEAETLFSESLEISRLLGAEWYIMRPLFGLGRALTRTGDLERARKYLQQVLQLIAKMQFFVAFAYLAAAFAYLAQERGDWEQSARLLAASRAFSEAMEAPFVPEDQSVYDQALEATRQALDEATFAAAWRQGTEMSLDQFLQLALDEEPR